MRKFTKLLTAVLALALLCTTFAVVAFAAFFDFDATGNLTINSDDDRIVQFSAQDFSGAATNKAPDGSMGYNSDPVTNTSFLTTTNGNQHFWYQRPATTQHAWAGVLSGPLDSQQDPTTWKMIDYDYVVVDFDFSSNAYVDYDATYLANGKGAWKLTETPDADSRLAYRPFKGSSMTRFWVDSKTKYNTSRDLFKVFADGNKWFIGDMNDTNAFELPSAKNEWTHISVIYEIDNSLTYDEAGKVIDTGLDNTKAHVYVNGSYLATASNIVDIDSYFGEGKTYAGQLNDYINKIGFQQIRLQCDYYTSDVSLCVDNISSYYYKKGYDGELANFVKNNVTSPICTNSDVVYSGDYVSPNGPIATVDGTAYSIEPVMLAAIKEGSAVSLSGNVSAEVYPKCAFTLVTNGYSFSVASDSGYVMAPTATAGTYNVRPITDADMATVIFGEKGSDIYAEVSVLPGTTASHPTLKAGTPVDGGLFLGWASSKGSTTGVNPVAGAIGTTTTYYPIYENVNYAYVMTDGNKVLAKGTDAKNFVTDYVASGAETKTLYIILGADLYATDLGQTLNPKGVTINFDLNGYDIYHTYVNIENKTPGNPAFINVGANTNLNIYSSRPGADLISLSHHVNCNNYTGPNTSGIVTNTGTSANSVVTFGNGTNNLTVHTSILMVNKSTSGTLVLNGGTYLAPRGNSLGFIISRDSANAALTVDINNAFIGASGATVFATNSGATITGTVNNSTIYATSLLGTWETGSSITFTNTKLSGSIGAKTATGSIVLGEKTQYTYETLPEFFTFAEGLVPFGINEKKDLSFNVYFPKSTDNKTFTEASLKTPVTVFAVSTFINKVIKESDVPKEVTVTWYDSYGMELYHETYFEGQTAVYDEAKGQYGFIRENDWFVSSIAAWAKTPGSDTPTSLVVSNSNKNFYVIDGLTPDIGAYQNYQTTSGIKRYAYIPVPTEGSGIEILSIYDVNRKSECYAVAKPSRFTIVEIGGVQFYQIWDAPGVVSTSVQQYTITYTYNGVEYTETEDFDNAITYFEKLLENEDVEVEAKILAVNAVRYMQTIFAYAGGMYPSQVAAENETINRLLAHYGKEWLITVSDEEILADYAYDVKNLTSIEGVTFAVGDGNAPVFAIMLKDGATVPTAKVQSVHSGTVEIKFARPATIYHYDKEANFDKLYFADAFGVWEVRQPITVYDGEATGTFSLAAYIMWLKSAECTQENKAEALAVCEALYAYSIASYNYKTRNAGK